ncbi:DUF4132 domain-containing protein [Streptomyces sp. NRRL F-5123]|uniref:DUF4132 domain-containing protein n=1 Tax=Streptomyces sp. NRRL F-5123 TaxID=1463856 RepID=UPI0006948089|nr:DUF4132 domain-containing protein [Streptomyces sp. NRRL F-5123]
MAVIGDYVVAVRGLAAEGDMVRLADRLVPAFADKVTLENGAGDKMLAEVAGLSPVQRRELVKLLCERYESLDLSGLRASLGLPDHVERPVRNGHRSWTPTVEEARETLLLVIVAGARGLGIDPLPGARAERVAELAGYSSISWFGDRPEWLVEAELAAGRAVPVETVATLRRTAATAYTRPGLAQVVKKLPDPPVNPGEAWSDDALATAALLGEPWTLLLRHAATATAARPTARWEKEARALVQEIGADAVRDKAAAWLALVGRPRTVPYDEEVHYGPDRNALIDPYNANALRGLVRTLALLPPHLAIPRALGSLVDVCLRKIPGHGPRNPKLANAGVTALARCEGEAALGELARLAARVTFRGTLKQIDRALEERAEALGLGREEVEELAVPAYGLTEVGLLRRTRGELAVRAGKAVLTWRNAAGKQVKGVPADVRRDHPEEVAELKAAAKDVDRMLAAQSERLDRQFLARRRWPYAAWRERVLDHPLVGTLARRLLWTVDGRACGFADGELRTLAGTPVPHGGATVELWHPVGREIAEVMAWREWLERHGITQPFKQAHREVYPLTDAERRTATYSNRFAAHVLRQHQFQSLAAARGWSSKLRLAVDDVYPPAVRELPEWGLRAEFWIEGADTHDLTVSGSYLHLTTDQVRFHRIGAPGNWAHAYGGGYAPDRGRDIGPEDGALPLEEIPPLVLSEVLRDVDLFVGVASVGNDPLWQDGGPDGRYRDYWHSYGFGELTVSAQGRRDVLARLVPRLAIADRCTVEGRFLHVRGDRHTYRIHLGSGNILIAPTDRYLCIVPGANKAADPGFLPFDGDRTLGLILSKALLLARDTEITDPTILSQL